MSSWPARIYKLTPIFSFVRVDACCSEEYSTCSEIETEEPSLGLIVANLSSSISIGSVGSLWTTMILKERFEYQYWVYWRILEQQFKVLQIHKNDWF